MFFYSSSTYCHFFLEIFHHSSHFLCDFRIFVCQVYRFLRVFLQVEQGSLKKRNAPGQGANVWTSLMGQSPISIPVMYSNGYIPSHGTDDNRNNPWVLATQSGYKEIWNNKIQTNISLEQKLDFITKGLRFEGRFGFDTSNQSEINRIRMPETWRAQRDRDDDGNLVFKQQNAEKPMEQTSSSSGERREFLEAFLQYNRAFKAHHVGAILKYTQDAYRTTVDIGTDVKNGVAKRHMGLALFRRFQFRLQRFGEFCRRTSLWLFSSLFFGLEHSGREIGKKTSEMDEYV